MAPLTHVVISPANIALEARLHRAKPLTRSQIKQLNRELKQVERRVAQLSHGHEERLARFQEVRESLRVLKQWKLELTDKRDQLPNDPHLQAQWEELLETARPLQVEYEKLRGHLKQWDEFSKQASQIRQRILDNPAVIERANAEAKSSLIQQEEAHAYEQLIIDRLTSMGYCYRWNDKRGNKRVDEVYFSEAHITMDAVFFKIAASYRTMFGGYKTQMPQGVRIQDLIHEDTLLELSYACQRQVTAKSNLTGGAWIVVHRLDTNDGLLNQVGYAAVMKSYPQKHHERLPLCVGVAYHRQVQWLNLGDYPHMLVAGFTGSGKSNFVNSIICNLISMHSPEEVRLVLVDLKDGLEFDSFGHIPHLHGQVVDKISALADTLQELEVIMQDRNHLMRGKAKRIQEWNAKYPDKKLPRIICIIDEVASIMGQGESTKRINHSLRQLTAKGRAPGIHIILSTQRPSVDAIDGGIKVNLAARIVGRMPSHTDSLTVLGSGDAKELSAVPGRMILQIGPDPMPVQTPLIDEGDIVQALKTAMEYPVPEPLPVPEGINLTEEWTPEKIIALSLNHLGGTISHKAVWDEIKEDGGLSRNQVRQMLERIWAQECITHDGKTYQAKRGARGTHKLIEVDQITNLPVSPQSTGSDLSGDLTG
jgi:S-DNA-T family DNA segregation ATPase FtsK/SpoIIIE